MWFMEFPIHEAPDSVTYLNSLEDKLSNFKGKLILYSLYDNQESPYTGLSDKILNRIDAWIVYGLHTHDKISRNKKVQALRNKNKKRSNNLL